MSELDEHFLLLTGQSDERRPLLGHPVSEPRTVEVAPATARGGPDLRDDEAQLLRRSNLGECGLHLLELGGDLDVSGDTGATVIDMTDLFLQE